MFQNKNNISSVMVGIGAAVDFISGNKMLAPKIIEKLGFSWFFRLVTEPKRLFMRYFITNSLFLILIFKQIFQKLVFNR
jgi:N-acetylglucosaminyldiphosphoundecaprenol N-acetyl-beta-D-mannosaminyltransferase